MRHTQDAGPRLIAVVAPTSGSYWMTLVRGILDTIPRYASTEVCLIEPVTIAGKQDFSRFGAIIARVGYDLILNNPPREGIPVINVSGALESTPFPLVTVDDTMVGEMAANYLAGLGLHRFAYCGDMSGFSHRRERAFAAALARLGKKYYPLVAESERSTWWLRRISEILQEPDESPLGLFALNDDAADSVMARMRRQGIRIPGSVAVLGVDNEELVQNRALPSLSSIEVPTYGIGCEAVHLAMRMMNSERNTPTSVLLPPCRVVARASTDILAVHNPSVLNAIAFIRENSRQSITVDDVAAAGAVPKRTLQRRFVEAVGTTIQEYIHSTRLDFSKDLLGDNRLSIKEAAFKAGFDSQSRFAKFFRREEGLTPQEYRNRILHGTSGSSADS